MLAENSADDHPGWTVLLPNGKWIAAGKAHYHTDNVLYATISWSKKDAEDLINDVANEWNEPELLTTAKIVPAWESLCRKLELENSELTLRINELKAVNNISPETIKCILVQLESFQDQLKKAL